MKPYTLITGASSGLGKSLAVAYAKKGKNLILISMSGTDLQQLSQHLQQMYQVDVRYFHHDLSDVASLKTFIENNLQQYPIDCLINNVGVGGSGSFLNVPLSALYLMIDLNLKSMVTLTHLLLPQLLKHEQSKIINVSSIAGIAPVAYKTIYPACKSFIKTFSLSLHEEFREKGLCVSTVFPGPMVTNTNTTERIVKQGLKARLSVCSTTDVAHYILQQASKLQRHIIPGNFNRVQYYLSQLLPEVLISKWVSRTIKKEIAT